MAKAPSNREMPVMSESIHDTGTTDLKLADKANADRITDLEDAVNKELASSRRAFVVSVIQTGAVLIGLAGGAVYLTDMRSTVKQMNDRLGSLEVTSALMQRDLKPIEKLEERIRELERQLDRLQIPQN